jgi:hypothetical protein
MSASADLLSGKINSRERYSRVDKHDPISTMASSRVGTPSPPPIVYRFIKAYKKESPAINEK